MLSGLVELNDAFFQKAAGWQAVQHARTLLTSGLVLSSNWAPPTLRGVVQVGDRTYRAGLVINSHVDIDNLCNCREARDLGILCPHSVAVGLHHVRKSAPLNTQKLPPTSGSSGNPTPPPRPPSLSTSSTERVSGMGSGVGLGDSSVSRVRPVRPVSQVRRANDSNSGNPLEINVIFPPKLGEAISKGRVLCVFEGLSRGQRAPLSSFAKSGVYHIDVPDQKVLDAAEALSGGDTPAMLQLSTADFVQLLGALVGHPRVTCGRQTCVHIENQPYSPPIRAFLETDGRIRLQTERTKETLLRLSGNDRDWVLHGDSSVNTPRTVSAAPSGKGDKALNRGQSTSSNHRSSPPTDSNPVLQPVAIPSELAKLWQEPVVIERPQVPFFLSQTWPQLEASGAVQANFTLQSFEQVVAIPKFTLELSGGLALLSATLLAGYGSRLINLGASDPKDVAWLPDPDHPRRYGSRNQNLERESVQRLQIAGFQGPNHQGQWVLTGQDRVLRFFARDHARLQRDWIVTMEARLERSASKTFAPISPNIKIHAPSSGVAWFDMEISYSGPGGETFSPADIQQLLRGGSRRLKDGRIAILDSEAVEELQETLLDCAPRQLSQDASTRYRVDHQQAAFLEGSLRDQGFDIQAPVVWKQKAQQMTGEIAWKCPPLANLDPVLRPYQKLGVAWLQFLRENQFGGILADEMGLGKTLQMLAYLRTNLVHPQNESSNPPKAHRPAPSEMAANLADTQASPSTVVHRPNLVICPSSLVFNWVAEAAKFTPELRVLALDGSDRHTRFSSIPNHDLIVTSYALIRRDLAQYQEIEFDTLLLDEAQHIKNRSTRNAQAVKALRSNYRIVLTGTPMENSVLDIWSLFDFLMPGYLGNADDFRERYELPIVREKDQAAMERLSRRIRPFLLRRTKREVLKDLPPKLEQVSYCELTEEQSVVYRQLLDATRKEVTESVDQQGLGRSRMLVLTALLRLRQVCCDLRLLTKKEPDSPTSSPDTTTLPAVNRADVQSEDTASSSGKVQMFLELLDEVVDGGHRVLVFSQFTSMLGLLREELEARDLEYCYLDGSTRDRKAVVEKFQSTANIPVFLISLKAGGVGLNLTGADTVIHFDPWWNPAVEDQATDRAHRIGQTRQVTNYKLITRNTVEEKILLLQRRKREWIDSALTGEEALTQSLSWEEIQELLA